VPTELDLARPDLPIGTRRTDAGSGNLARGGTPLRLLHCRLSSRCRGDSRLDRGARKAPGGEGTSS
jgi:hypothetical protein